MKNYRFLINTAFLLAVILGLSNIADGQNRQALAKAQSVTGDRFSFAVRTSKGTNVYAVERPSSAMLSAIDKGLSDLFAVARRNGYNRRLNYSDYTIFIARADRDKDSQGQYSPDIAVGAAQYAGTDYDQGGYIYAAGMVVSFNSPGFVIANHRSNFGRVSDVVRFEGEHLVLYHNDRRLYGRTADHSRGGGHPILK